MTETNYIILNGQLIFTDEIPQVFAQKSGDSKFPEWETELFLFLMEWFSETEIILAQTSGSTGEPKRIELPKSVMRKSAERTIQYFGLKKDDRLLLSLSCQYIAGKMMVVRAITGQMNLITVDPASEFNFLEAENYDLGAMVPNQVIKILEQPSGKIKLENIRNLLIGGSAISSALELQISPFSNRIVSTYGMTETASHIAFRELSGENRSDIYQCLPGISVSLSENDCLKIHLSDFDEPLQTNDISEIISDKQFKILGRADSVIISGGIKYSPEWLEKKLESLIDSRFVISSVPDEKLGEKLVLVIEGKQFDTNILELKLAAQLSTYEKPKSICFLNHFPETGSAKIVRKEVQQIIQKNA